ncbi:MAG: ABC-2 family transporter protein [Anaerolineae bacterium]|nr:ABC-2 family transporter protein [Anaerolineae bacterium]
MRLYWELARQAFRLQMTYRAANLAGLATNFFFGLLRAAVLVALYGERGSVSGMSLQAAVTYTGLSQATIACLMFFGWWDVMDAVYSGDIAADLLKPIDYYAHWLARDLGRAAASFAMRAVTIMVAYAVVFEIVVPRSLGHWLLLGCSLLLSIALSFAWRFLVNLAAFWSPDARGIGRLAFGISWFTSGFLMPMRLLPDWFARLCSWTPFPSMVNTVTEVYLGVLDGPALLRALGAQAIWFVALSAACQLVLRAGVRHLVIQGG